MSTIPRPHLLTRLWAAYSQALQRAPLRTKMAQTGVLYVTADLVAQVGIEGKSVSRAAMGERGEEVYDPVRTARLTIYGSTIFAPLAHLWLSRLERIKMGSKLKTLAAKLALDCGLWSPFVTFMFPTCLGLLEGRSVQEVQKKVAYGWFPTWQKAVCVFGPTQVINFSLVPPQHRLLTIQSVALGWNIFLSWQNNRNNKTLALAEARLAEAQQHMREIKLDQGIDMTAGVGSGLGISEEEEKGRRAVEAASKAVDVAEKRKAGLKKEGGEMGVGVKMAWS